MTFADLPEDVWSLLASCLPPRALLTAVSSLEVASRATQALCLRELWHLPCEAMGVNLREAAAGDSTSFDGRHSAWKERLRACWGDPCRSEWGAPPSTAPAASCEVWKVPAMACVSCLAYGGWPPRLVAGDHGGSVYVYDMTEMRLARGGAAPPPSAPLLQRQDEHDGPVTCIAIGAAHAGPARFFFTAGEDATVVVWGLATGQLLRTLNGHSKSPTVLHPSPDGSCLFTGGDDKTARLWFLGGGHSAGNARQAEARALHDPAFGSAVDMLIGHKARLTGLCFEPFAPAPAAAAATTVVVVSGLLVSICRRGTVMVWHVHFRRGRLGSGKKLPQQQRAQRRRSSAATAACELMATMRINAPVESVRFLWDHTVKSGNQARRLRKKKARSAVGGLRMVLVACGDGGVRAIDFSEQATAVQLWHVAMHVAAAPVAAPTAAKGPAKTVEPGSWGAAQWRLLQNLSKATDELAGGGSLSLPSLRLPSPGKAPATVLSSAVAPAVAAVCIPASTEGGQDATPARDIPPICVHVLPQALGSQRAMRRSSTSLAPVYCVEGLLCAAATLCRVEHEMKVVGGCEDGSVCVWSLWRERTEKDGGAAAAASTGGKLCSSLQFALQGHACSVRCLVMWGMPRVRGGEALVGDGGQGDARGLMASTDDSGVLRVWDLETGVERHALLGGGANHSAVVTHAIRCGDVLVTCSMDRTIRLYDGRVRARLAPGDGALALPISSPPPAAVGRAAAAAAAAAATTAATAAPRVSAAEAISRQHWRQQLAMLVRGAAAAGSASVPAASTSGVSTAAVVLAQATQGCASCTPASQPAVVVAQGGVGTGVVELYALAEGEPPTTLQHVATAPVPGLSAGASVVSLDVAEMSEEDVAGAPSSRGSVQVLVAVVRAGGAVDLLLASIPRELGSSITKPAVVELAKVATSPDGTYSSCTVARFALCAAQAAPGARVTMVLGFAGGTFASWQPFGEKPTAFTSLASGDAGSINGSPICALLPLPLQRGRRLCVAGVADGSLQLFDVAAAQRVGPRLVIMAQLQQPPPNLASLLQREQQATVHPGAGMCLAAHAPTPTPVAMAGRGSTRAAAAGGSFICSGMDGIVHVCHARAGGVAVCCSLVALRGAVAALATQGTDAVVAYDSNGASIAWHTAALMHKLTRNQRHKDGMR